MFLLWLREALFGTLLVISPMAQVLSAILDDLVVLLLVHRAETIFGYRSVTLRTESLVPLSAVT